MGLFGTGKSSESSSRRRSAQLEEGERAQVASEVERRQLKEAERLRLYGPLSAIGFIAEL